MMKIVNELFSNYWLGQVLLKIPVSNLVPQLEIAPNLFLRGVGVISRVLTFDGFFGVRNSELGCFDGDFGLEGGVVDKALLGDLGCDLDSDLDGDVGVLEVEGVTAGEF